MEETAAAPPKTEEGSGNAAPPKRRRGEKASPPTAVFFHCLYSQNKEGKNNGTYPDEEVEPTIWKGPIKFSEVNFNLKCFSNFRFDSQLAGVAYVFSFFHWCFGELHTPGFFTYS